MVCNINIVEVISSPLQASGDQLELGEWEPMRRACEVRGIRAGC